MGALITRVNDDLAKLDADETQLDEVYKAKKIEIIKRRTLLQFALTKITDDLERLVDALGVEVK